MIDEILGRLTFKKFLMFILNFYFNDTFMKLQQRKLCYGVYIVFGTPLYLSD